jgi:hypothetical protein
MIDAGLALAVAVVVTISIRVSPYPGDSPDVLAYALGLTIAALALVRRRWPVAVLLVSAATMQVYHLLDYPGIRPAVPLAVALATAWAAGHQRWSLLVVAWFAGAPLLFRTLVDPDPRPDHAQAVAEMAMAIRDEVARRTDPGGQPLAVRIGIDTDPVVAGVIWTSKCS